MKTFIYLLCIGLLSISNIFGQEQAKILFFEDFESAQHQWAIEGDSLWESGPPTAGLTYAYSGSNVAGTNINGKIPSGSKSRLISPQIELPELSPGERIELRFWQWSYSGPSNEASILILDGNNSCGLRRIVDIKKPGNSKVWTHYILNLDKYAGSAIAIAFQMHAVGTTSYGWYIDDVSVEVTSATMANPETFETATRYDWAPNPNIWVTDSARDVSGAHSGNYIAGTMIKSRLSGQGNVRLVSPPYDVPNISEGERIELRFWQWSYTDNNDKAIVQVSTDDGLTWENVSEYVLGNKKYWAEDSVDISAYAGQRIRLGFLYAGNSNGYGWYLDDISISGIVVGIDQSPEYIPKKYTLYNAYPNPFNPTTTIIYELPKTADVTLAIFNSLGQKVATLVKAKQPAGTYTAIWDGTGIAGKAVASGIYYYQVTTPENAYTGKMVLLK